MKYMAISIEVFSNRVYKTVGDDKGFYTKGAYTKIGSKDKDGNENYGVIDYYLVQGFKLELEGVDTSYVRRMKNIKVNVESLSKNEVNVCGVQQISIINNNGRYFTSIIPVICTKLKKEYLNCGIGSNPKNFNYQLLTFELSYDIKDDDGVDRTYHTQSSNLKFVTGRIVNKTNDERIQPIMNAMEIPSFYRPFYFNAVLLLFPKNMGIDEYTHACEFNRCVRDASNVTLNHDDRTTNEDGEEVGQLYEDSKKCHGRLFYSIANGTSMSEKMISKNDNGVNDGNKIVNYLSKVVLDVNQGEYSLTIKKPFRFYDELDSVYKKNGENNAAQDTYKDVESLTKKVAFGITEPFIVDTEKGEIYRDGIALINYNNEGNIVSPVLKRCNKENITFNGDNLKIINGDDKKDNRNYVFNDSDRKYRGTKKKSIDKQFYFPIDDKTKDLYFQSKGAWYSKSNNSMVYEIDTTKMMSFSFSVTDAAPSGHEEEATTISLNYNGIKFYDEILEGDNYTYTVNGSSSEGVRYFLIMSKKESGYDAPLGELDEIMRSIYDFSVCDTNEPNKFYSTPKIRYNGLNTNDYIAENKKSVSHFCGWQGIYTSLKITSNTIYLYGNYPSGSDHRCIDITAKLKQCEGGQSVVHKCGNCRPIIIGLYDSYTALEEDEYNDSKDINNRFKYIKPHTNRFSIVKVYKVSNKTC